MQLSQYTVLTDVNPGHHNTFEYVGLCLVFIGAVGQPIRMLFCASSVKEETNEKSQLIESDEKTRNKPVVSAVMPNGTKLNDSQQ